MIASWQESCKKPRQCVEKKRHYSGDKSPYSQGYGLPCGHLWFWEPDRKEGRVPKNWCLWTVVLERTPENPLDSKKIKPIRNKPWIFIGRTDAEAEAPVFWSTDENSQFNGRVPDAGKDWGQKEKRVSEDEMAGWYQWTWTWANLGRWWGWGSLACCSPWSCKELEMTGRLNNNNILEVYIPFQKDRLRHCTLASSMPASARDLACSE